MLLAYIQNDSSVLAANAAAACSHGCKPMVDIIKNEAVDTAAGVRGRQILRTPNLNNNVLHDSGLLRGLL